MPSKLFICEKKAHVEELIHHCHTTKVASIDYETTSFHYANPSEYPLILGVSFQPGSSWILPMGHKESPFQKTYTKHFRTFSKEVLENRNITKVAWNLKFEYKWGLRLDSIMQGRLFDGMLAKYCLDEEKPFDLKNFAATFFPEFANYEEKISPKGIKDAEKIKWADKPFLPLCEYCGIDADVTLRGMNYMEERLMKTDLYNLFRNLLMMAARVLGESEYRGILVNRSYLEDLMQVYKVKIASSNKNIENNPALLKFEKKYARHHVKTILEGIQDEIDDLKDSDAKNTDTLIRNRYKKIENIRKGIYTKKDRYDGFNPNSPDQLATFLFTSPFGLQLKSKKKTKTGKYATDEDTLEALKKYDKTAFLDSILKHRGLTKLDSTYISGVHPLLDLRGRVHAGYKIHGTVTGRLSCADPNLQNIPRDTTASDIKKMFIPPPGYVLLEVDYGQAELRLAAEVAKDQVMIDLFKKGYNIHVATACKLNGGIEQYEEVKKIIKIGDNMSGEEAAKPENEKILFWLKQKKRAKSLNFSILYGQGDDAMAEEMECTPTEAHQFKLDWLNQYKGIKKWMKAQLRFAREHGYVPMLFGRKRRLHMIDDPAPYLRAEAERQAINAPIQGTSSDFLLFASVLIREKVLSGELPPDLQQAYTVHDSLGLWVRPADIHWVVPIIDKICRNPDTLKYFGFELKYVEMKVSPEIGVESWGDLNEYHPETNYVKLMNTWQKNTRKKMRA